MIVHPVYALTRRRDAATGLKRGGAAQGIQFSRSRPAHRHPLRCGSGGGVDIALDASPSDIASHGRRRKKAGISVAIRRGTGDFKAFLIFPEPFQRFLGKSSGSEGVLSAWRGKKMDEKEPIQEDSRKGAIGEQKKTAEARRIGR